VRTYGQYCPIARAAEILAERWTPIIVRNLLLGATSFNQIADGAPGISRTLLTYRLKELEQAGVITVDRTAGRRVVYQLTRAGSDLSDVMLSLGTWGERWLELGPPHLDPGVVLDSWVRWYLARDALPDRRVVVRFDLPDRPRKANQLWMIFDGDRTEVCRTNPGFAEDLIVTAASRALAEWHLGRIAWADALRTGQIDVAGLPSLARALPTWNKRSGWARLEIVRDGASAAPA
jgi:DNA-binding HxlR family transcriptional regulator